MVDESLWTEEVQCRHVVVKGKQNMGAPNFVRQAYTMHISIKCQDCSVVPVSREAHEVRLDASIVKS